LFVGMFVTVCHFHPSLLFVGKAKRLNVERTHMVVSSRISRVEVTDSDKHPSLLRYIINKSCEKFNDARPRRLYYKLFLRP
jgi:hypothetical protein